MNRKVVTAIFSLSAVFAIGALAQAQSSTGKQAGLTNPGFEEPRGNEGSFTFVETMPGWKTTDTAFEIWDTGFNGVEAHHGNQFVELNAYIDGTLYQDSTGIEPGAVLEFTFAHRGRNGKDTMKLTITDLGQDNSPGGGDDTVLFTKEYATGMDAWAVYDSTTEQKIQALRNTVRFAYSAVSGTGGKGADKTEGNFLDSADFGVGVVTEGHKAAPLTNSIGMQFARIPAGTFMMGSPESEEGREADEVQHEVTITRDYYLGIAEVTQSQWQQVMETTPWKGQKNVEEGKENAASYISWDDAGKFCRKLSDQEGRTYRLPTEAEWEYACRGGTTTPYSFGDDASQLEQYAWHFGSKPNHASQVKQKSPSGFGLYDMHGNVWEYCRDWYFAYPQGSVTDPGPSSGSYRMKRGGSFIREAPFFRSAYRSSVYNFAERGYEHGLRVVLVPRSDFSSGQLALNRAKDLLRGHWIPNLDETAKRLGELQASEREVLSILAIEFTSRSISLLVQDEPVSLSIHTELVTPNERYNLKQTEAGYIFQLELKDEEGVEHVDEVRFLSETQILVTLGKGGRPVVLDWSRGVAEDTSGVAEDTSHSTVVGWGNNEKGQTDIPEGLSDIIAIAAGGEHSMALKQDGTVVAWGKNASKQADIPEGLSGVIAIAAGGDHSLALKQDGTVVAWGYDFFGQTRVPEGLSGVTAIAAGNRFSMALKADGTVVAWGEVANYLLIPPEELSGVTAIAAGAAHSLALKQDGTVVAWGTCTYGYYKRDVPEGLSGVTAIAAAWSHHDVALKQDGTIVGWATPDSPNDPPDVFGEPTFPEGLSGITAIDAGEKYDLALKQDGTVVAWGSNEHGVADIPEGLSDVSAIAAGRKHGLALVRKGKAQ